MLCHILSNGSLCRLEVSVVICKVIGQPIENESLNQSRIYSRFLLKQPVSTLPPSLNGASLWASRLTFVCHLPASARLPRTTERAFFFFFLEEKSGDDGRRLMGNPGVYVQSSNRVSCLFFEKMHYLQILYEYSRKPWRTGTSIICCFFPFPFHIALGNMTMMINSSNEE